MEKTTEKLKIQHKQIIKLLNEIEGLTIFSAQFREKMKEAKDLFIDHLKFEDDKLYPRLKVASVSDEGLSKELSYLSEEMHEVTSDILFFFDKFSNDHANDKTDFMKTFALVKKSLLERIKKEEEFIYEKFIELTDKKTV